MSKEKEIMLDETMVEDIEVIDMEPETSGGGVLGKVIVGAVVAGVGALGVLAYKNRNKIEERRIKKLEKKGYVVLRPEPVESGDDFIDEINDKDID